MIRFLRRRRRRYYVMLLLGGQDKRTLATFGRLEDAADFRDQYRKDHRGEDPALIILGTTKKV